MTHPAPAVLIVEADGGSRGNPGLAGYGALVRDGASGEILDCIAEPLGTASNNVAEYSGLVAGLKLAQQINPDAEVTVRMDSKLVVEQMSGRWKIKHADMQRLAAEAAELAPPGKITYTWIPREKNKDADLLSNEAMDAGASGIPWDKAQSGLAQRLRSANTSEPQPVEPQPHPAEPQPTGRLHHVEIWVKDIDEARNSLGWLFQQVGYTVNGQWSEGTSYQGAGEYLVLESGPDVVGTEHDRQRPGLNHLAFHAGTRENVERIVEAAVARGFTLLFPERHPFAGGRNHYAAYISAPNGFEVELVAA